MEETSRRFKVPLVSEVAKYMNEKMGWHPDFCHWYAEKFWNHYNAAGWTLNGNRKMKSWTSAFANNWKELKYEEDRKKLVEFIKASEAKHELMLLTNSEFCRHMDHVLDRYSQNQKPSREVALKLYDECKRRGMNKSTKEYIEKARTLGGNDIGACKMWALKFMFDLMIERGLNFTQRYGNNTEG